MSYLTTQTDDRGVTTITLNRPETYNAMDRRFIDELTSNIKALKSNTRILVITANGKHFCSGTDIQWMTESAESSKDQNQADARALADMLQTLDTFAFPTIAKVRGAALGGGSGIVSCCDIVVADEDASFAFPEVRLGLIPATISPFAIAAIGPRAARRYLLTGEPLNVLDAYRLGLVHDVTSSDNLDNSVENKIKALLSGGPNAQIATKQLICDVTGCPKTNELHDQLAARLAATRNSSEGKEGMNAFLEKRPADWT